MKPIAAIGLFALTLGFSGAAGTAQPPPATAPAPKLAPAAGKGAEAMSRAASAGQYLFVFFYEKDDDATRTARKAFDEAAKKLSPAPLTAAVDRTAPGERELVAKFAIDRAPMPLIIAIAPSGAVTGGFKASEPHGRPPARRGGQPRAAKMPQSFAGPAPRARVPAKRPHPGQRRRHERRQRVQGRPAVW